MWVYVCCVGVCVVWCVGEGVCVGVCGLVNVFVCVGEGVCVFG